MRAHFGPYFDLRTREIFIPVKTRKISVRLCPLLVLECHCLVTFVVHFPLQKKQFVNPKKAVNHWGGVKTVTFAVTFSLKKDTPLFSDPKKLVTLPSAKQRYMALTVQKQWDSHALATTLIGHQYQN